jgi:putative PIN family toxin of toxin-antitoxin system
VRAVIDSNVLISGLLWRGPPHQLLAHLADGTLSLVSSPALLAELLEVLKRPKFAKIVEEARVDLEALVNDVRFIAEVLDPPPLERPVSRDPDDDAVLSLAVHARADFIITGDADLLTLTAYAGIPILTPAQALAKIEA